MQTLTRTIAGVERRFSLLSQYDLADLTLDIPSPSGEIIDLRGLSLWAKNPIGCERFLAVAATKAGDKTTAKEAGKWGSINDRANIAVEIFGLSIRSGEEVPGPKAQGGEANTSPQTGS